MDFFDSNSESARYPLSRGGSYQLTYIHEQRNTPRYDSLCCYKYLFSKSIVERKIGGRNNFKNDAIQLNRQQMFGDYHDYYCMLRARMEKYLYIQGRPYLITWTVDNDVMRIKIMPD
jgi:hypothetical protein